MKRILFILLLFILVGCSQEQDLLMEGNPKAKEYIENFYDTDIKKLKVDFVSSENFKQLKTQNNKFIVLAVSPQCEFCKTLVPNFVNLLNDYKIGHMYFVKFEELTKDEQKLIAETFTSKTIPTVLFFKNGNISEFQGEFDLQRLTYLIEEYIKD